MNRCHKGLLPPAGVGVGTAMLTKPPSMRTVLPVKRNQPLCVAAVLRQLLYTLKSLKHPAQRAAFDAALCSVQFAALGFIAGGLLGRNQAFKCTLKRLPLGTHICANLCFTVNLHFCWRLANHGRTAPTLQAKQRPLCFVVCLCQNPGFAREVTSIDVRIVERHRRFSAATGSSFRLQLLCLALVLSSQRPTHSLNPAR